jgi:hypothetical protein
LKFFQRGGFFTYDFSSFFCLYSHSLRVKDIPFARASTTKYRSVASASRCPPFFGPVKLLVVVFQYGSFGQIWDRSSKIVRNNINTRILFSDLSNKKLITTKKSAILYNFKKLLPNYKNYILSVSAS